ncbi:MAG: hypothetical protein LBJ67_10635 [Planctomycetaceae bacterium]|nr:hypothetical protein [Planctomycetaceae bacterium]
MTNALLTPCQTIHPLGTVRTVFQRAAADEFGVSAMKKTLGRAATVCKGYS